MAQVNPWVFQNKSPFNTTAPEPPPPAPSTEDDFTDGTSAQQQFHQAASTELDHLTESLSTQLNALYNNNGLRMESGGFQIEGAGVNPEALAPNNILPEVIEELEAIKALNNSGQADAQSIWARVYNLLSEVKTSLQTDRGLEDNTRLADTLSALETDGQQFASGILGTLTNADAGKDALPLVQDLVSNFAGRSDYSLSMLLGSLQNVVPNIVATHGLEAAGDLVNRLVNVGARGVQAAGEVVNAVANHIDAMVDTGIATAQDVARFISNLAGAGAGAVADGLNTLYNGLMNLGERGAEFFGDVLAGLTEQGNSVGEIARNNLKDGMSRFITNGFSHLPFSPQAELFQQAITHFSDAAAFAVDAGRATADFVTDVFGDVMDAHQRLGRQGLEALKEAWDNTRDFTRNVFQDIGNGLSSLFNTLFGWLF